MKMNEIEQKWQKFWEDNHIFEAKNDSKLEPYYVLVEFPYPSGSGLHVGHVRSYTAQDAIARLKRMQGYNVLYPMGWDAFGAPAESYAIKNNIHPKEAVKENIKNFKKQMKSLGFSFDWTREFSTTDPEYYKWTQWQFLQFYKHNMAYKATAKVNWCPNCKTVLSNEDAAGGVCERCQTKVEQKEKSQWMLKMSSYAEDLLKGLDETNFADRVKLGQINWIGKSKGVEVDIPLVKKGMFKIFTTCIETIYGVTFFVIAPDGKLIKELWDDIENKEEVKSYIEKTKNLSNMARTELNKEKKGCELKGIMAIHPLTKEHIKVYTGDFVLGEYGTGAVMAVPSHDERDFEFAKYHKLPMIQVIEGQDTSEKAFEKQDYLNKNCRLINSQEFTGLTVEEAKEKITEKLVKENVARVVNNYKMRDWIFSRQRFWGEPIPMIYCEKCGWVPMDEKDLPLLLPDVVNYVPTEDGESPLAKIDSWVNTTCPKCKGKAKRETDTMPNWAGSSWYFLRFMDPKNDKEFASMKSMKYWNKVNWYNGGMEHTARHLLYARFWVQFLYNIGLVPNKEMIWTRVSHGMVLGANNEKMSKSKGNVINPDDIIKEYGADTLRIYEVFMGDYEQDVPWSTDSLKGCKRFLDKVIRLKDKVIDKDEYSKDLENLIHKSIKKVEEDTLNISYNTAISTLMILTNAYNEKDYITKKDYHLLLTLLNPYAPHITEQLNEEIGYKPICLSPWPKYDEEKTIDHNITIGVQVNGKIRSEVEITLNEKEETVKEKVLKIDKIAKYLENGKLIKFIYVSNKIVNLIIK